MFYIFCLRNHIRRFVKHKSKHNILVILVSIIFESAGSLFLSSRENLRDLLTSMLYTLIKINSTNVFSKSLWQDYIIPHSHLLKRGIKIIFFLKSVLNRFLLQSILRKKTWNKNRKIASNESLIHRVWYATNKLLSTK